MNGPDDGGFLLQDMLEQVLLTPKASQSRGGTLIRQVFVQPEADNPRQAWRQVAAPLRPSLARAARPHG